MAKTAGQPDVIECPAASWRKIAIALAPTQFLADISLATVELV